MKYTKKTAIEIMTEEDNKTFEKFFRSIQGDCENLIGYPLSKGDVIYLTSFNKIAQMFSTTKRELKKRGYTILKGVPKDWREESEPTEPSRLDQLESENNELKNNQIPKSLIDLVYNVKRMVECYQYGKIGIAERELGLIKESLDDIMRLPKEKTQDF